ncbi:hypothetical protein FACS1894186_5750 [Alphaproteobacteria bacterium]|nr:hypothetical protein FACS1894186_5750 [Alphaproteobacteria bacterium]
MLLADKELIASLGGAKIVSQLTQWPYSTIYEYISRRPMPEWRREKLALLCPHLASVRGDSTAKLDKSKAKSARKGKKRGRV